MSSVEASRSGDDHYALLGVDPSADFAALLSAYRRAALQTHPDKGGDAESFRRVTSAFESLSNDALRAVYDQRRTMGSTAEAKRRHNTRSRRATDTVGQADEMPTDDTTVESECKRPRTAAPHNIDTLLESLRSALNELRAKLQCVRPQRRAELLESLDELVRARLLGFMKTRSDTATATVTSPTITTTIPDGCSDLGEVSSSDDSASGEEDCDQMLALDNVPAGEHECHEIPCGNLQSGADGSFSHRNLDANDKGWSRRFGESGSWKMRPLVVVS